MGGYAGVGWKGPNNVLLSFAADAGETLSGYKENWTLQEAQVTGRTNPELKLQMTPSECWAI